MDNGNPFDLLAGHASGREAAPATAPQAGFSVPEAPSPLSRATGGAAVGAREAAGALSGDDPLSFLPEDARPQAARLGELAFPGEGREAAWLAAWYSAHNHETYSRCFARLPQLLEEYGDGKTPKEAFEAIRARVLGEAPGSGTVGDALKAGGIRAAMIPIRLTFAGIQGTVGLYCRLAENDQGFMTPEDKRRIARLREFNRRLGEYVDEQVEGGIGGWADEYGARAVEPGWFARRDHWARNAFRSLVMEAPRQGVQMLSAALLGPWASALVIGVDSGYRKDYDLKQADPGMDPMARRTNAVLTGLVNSGSAWTLSDILRGSPGELLKVGRSAWREIPRFLARSAAIEAGQEMAEQTAENAVDILTGRRGEDGRPMSSRSLGDGVLEEGFMGGAFGLLASLFGLRAHLRGQRQANRVSDFVRERGASGVTEFVQSQRTALLEQIDSGQDSPYAHLAVATLSELDAFGDAATPEQAAHALLTLEAWANLKMEEALEEARRKNMAAPIEVPAESGAAASAEADEDAAQSAPDARREARRRRLEADASAAEAEYAGLELAPHNPKDTVAKVAKVSRSMPGVKFHVFEGEANMPAEVRRDLVRRGRRARAFLYKGEVYIDAAKVRPSEVTALALHEAAAHGGLRALFPGMEGDLDALLDGVWEANRDNAEMLALARLYAGRDRVVPVADADGSVREEAFLTARQRREVAEEFLARVAERGVRPSWWKGLVQRVRQELAGMGLARDIRMDDEQVSRLLGRALSAVRPLFSRYGAVVPASAGGTRFSLSGLPDGTLFVEVDTDQDIFDGVDVADYPKIARKEILKRFSGRVIGAAPDDAFVNVRSANEYAYPADHRMNPEVKAAKMRAATELDNLMRAGRPVEEAVADDGRHEEVKDWKYYDVTFRVGEQFFDGKINIKRNAKGRLFYDVTDIKKTAGGPATQYEVDAPARRYRPGSEPNLAPNSEIASRSGKIPGNSGEAASGAHFDLEEDKASYARRLEQARREYAEVEAKYKGTPQWMKAPNGNATNLSERQWVQMRTPSFKAWFGDWEADPENASKVVDENGEPMVVYHGTNQGGYTVFRTGVVGSYFASNRKTAENFSLPLWGQNNSQIYNCFINMRSPFIVDAQARRYDSIARPQEMGEGNNVEVAELSAYAHSNGYDGVIVQNVIEGDGTATDDYVVFTPNQAKSATDNTGVFSEQEGDIRFDLEELPDNVVREWDYASQGMPRNFLAPDDAAVPRVEVLAYHARPDSKGPLSDARAAMKSLADELGGQPIEHPQMKLYLTGKKAAGMMQHPKKGNVPGYIYGVVARNFRTLVENSLHGQSHGDNKATGELAQVHRFFSAFTYAGQDYAVMVVAKEYRRSPGAASLYAARPETIEVTPLKKTLPGTQEAPGRMGSNVGESNVPQTVRLLKFSTLIDIFKLDANFFPEKYREIHAGGENSGKNAESPARYSLEEDYGPAERELMVRALRPFVGEAIDCDPADYLDALRMHGMRVDSEADALWLAEEAVRRNVEEAAGESARELAERERTDGASSKADAGDPRVQDILRAQARRGASLGEAEAEMRRLGVPLEGEALGRALSAARKSMQGDARRAFRLRRNDWLLATDPLLAALAQRGYDIGRFAVRLSPRFAGQDYSGAFIAGRTQADTWRGLYVEDLDKLARAVSDENPALGDELEVEQRILDRLDGMSQATLDEEYRQSLRRERLEGVAQAEQMKSEQRRELSRRALDALNAREPFDQELIDDDPELAQMMVDILTGVGEGEAGRLDAGKLGPRGVAAVDAAIRHGVEGADGFVRGYMEGSGALPEMLRAARTAERDRVAERLRKTVERLENKNKEERARARTEEAETMRRLREAVRADQADLEKLARAARERAAQVLPPELRGQYVEKVLGLARVSNRPTKAHPRGQRAEAFDALMGAMDTAGRVARRDADIEAMLKLAERYHTRRNWKGVPVSLLPMVQRQIDRIGEVLRMGPDAAGATMARNHALLARMDEEASDRASDGLRSWTREEVLEDNEILQEYGLLRNKTDAEAQRALYDLRALASSGRAEFARRVAERTARWRESAARMKTELQGTRSVRGRASGEDFDARSIENGALVSHLATSSIFRLLAGNGMGDFDRTEAGRLYAMVEGSEWDEARRNRLANERFNAAVDRLSGADGWAARKAWWKEVGRVVEKSGVFKLQYSAAYGSREDGTSYLRAGERRGRRGTVEIEAARGALAEFEAGRAATVATEELGTVALDEVSAGFLRRQLADIDAKLDPAATAGLSADPDLDAEWLDALRSLREAGKVQVVLPDPREISEVAEVPLSQGQALQVWLTWAQEDARAGMRWNGWTDEAIAQLEKFLLPEVKALGEWMRNELEAGRAELDAAAYAKFGAHLPDNPAYWPTRYAVSTRGGLSSGGAAAATLTPGFLVARRFHTRPLDPARSAFEVFASAQREQAHFLSWWRTLDEISGVVGQPDVKDAIVNRYSQRLLDEFKKRVALLRGNPAADFDAGVRGVGMFAVSKLGFNFVSIAKQFLGQVAYMNDCTAGEFVRAWGGVVTLSDGYRRFLRAALDSEYLKARMSGNADRDLRHILNSRARQSETNYNPLCEWLVETAYRGTMAGDLGSCLTGGYGAYLHAYEARLRAGMDDAQAHAEAMRFWQRSTDETQQSGYRKDQNAWQQGNWMQKALTMFKANPIQVSNREFAALRTAWEQGGRTWGGFMEVLRSSGGRPLLRTLFVNHLVVPALMALASGIGTYGIFDLWDEEDYIEDVVDMLLGDWSSVAVFGAAVRQGLAAALRAMLGKPNPAWSGRAAGDVAPSLDTMVEDVAGVVRAAGRDGNDLEDVLRATSDALELTAGALDFAGQSGLAGGAAAVGAAARQSGRFYRMTRDEETRKKERRKRGKQGKTTAK